MRRCKMRRKWALRTAPKNASLFALRAPNLSSPKFKQHAKLFGKIFITINVGKIICVHLALLHRYEWLEC